MSASLPSGLQWLLVATPLAVVLTLVVSPIALWWYRRRVAHWMSQGQPDDGARPGPGHRSDDTPPGAPLRWMRLGAPPAAATARSGSAARLGVLPARLRLLAGHAASGFVCALALTLAFSGMVAHLLSAWVVPTLLLAALVPTVALLLVLQVTAFWQRALGIAAASALPWLLPENLRGLAIDLYQLFVLAPLALLLIVGMRFWRGVAPMVLLLALAACAMAVAVALVSSRWLGVQVSWDWRLAGLIAGGLIGFQALQAVQRAFDAGSFSDLELFTDTWWLTLLLAQALALAVASSQAAYLLLLAAYPPAVMARRLVWRLWPLAQPDAPPRALLLLRVFSDASRVEALFDGLEQHWRPIGPIHMIAGKDLALRNVGPSDFVAFVAGRLRSQFVGSLQELDARLQDLPTQRDADGRFRVSHFWCENSTWQPTMRALAARSHAVVMDLRGFTADRQGCRYELLHLSRHMPDLPVLLLVDSPQVYAALQGLLGGIDSHQAAWMVADVSSEQSTLPLPWLARLAGDTPA